MSDLKPCPFCGSEDITYGADAKASAGQPALYITWRQCLRCFARGPAIETAGDLPKDSEDTEAWNARTPDPRVSRLVEALEAIRQISEDMPHGPTVAMGNLARTALSEWEGEQ